MSFLTKIFTTLKKYGPIILLYKSIERFNIYYFNKLMLNNKWNQASYVGERIIAHYPNEVWFYRKLIECYRNLKDDERANQILGKYIDLKFNSFNRKITEIESQLSINRSVNSQYKWIGGHQNNGFIEHHIGSKKYLTKMCPNYEWRERTFYLEIYNNYTKIKSITPKMVYLSETSNLNMYCITSEKIDGGKLIFTDEIIKEVFHKIQIINAIKYDEISNLFPLSYFPEGYLLDLINKESNTFGVLRYFNEVYRELPNREIFNDIQKQMKDLNYARESIKLIDRLRMWIIDNELYKKVIPELHYSLRHGDLTDKNMIIDKNSGEVLFIDWGQVGIGPCWYDIAGFLGDTKIPFNRIRNLCLSSNNTGKVFDPIEELFFIYTLIIVWLNVFSKDEFDNNIELYLMPAIEHIEYLGEEILNSDKLNQKFIAGL